MYHILKLSRNFLPSFWCSPDNISFYFSESWQKLQSSVFFKKIVFYLWINQQLFSDFCNRWHTFKNTWKKNPWFFPTETIKKIFFVLIKTSEFLQLLQKIHKASAHPVRSKEESVSNTSKPEIKNSFKLHREQSSLPSSRIGPWVHTHVLFMSSSCF